MSTVLINDSTLTDIGNAIRGKNGSSDLYYPSDMATAIANIPSGGLGPITVPTYKNKTIRDDMRQLSDFSSIFSTQEEMLANLVDIFPEKNAASGRIGSDSVSTPVWKDIYGRWIPLKDLGISLPSSFTIGSNWNDYLSKTTIQNLYNDGLVFGSYSTDASYFSNNPHWYIIRDRYLIGCQGEYVGYMSNTNYVLYTEA